MARQVKRLSVVGVRSLKAPGRYADGDGLYLYVTPAGSKSWVFRYRDRLTAKLRDKGLGPVRDVTLERAREKASECRASLLDGSDPIDLVKRERAAATLERSRQVTFGECAKRYMTAHRAGWRNAKHAAQWQSTLDTYAASLAALPVADVDTGRVLKAIEGIWSSKTETATRVRQRIEAILDWASARGYRTGENPARWRGHLQKLLPPPAKLKDVQHRPALPYTDLPSFMAELREKKSLGAMALQLQVLTATRPGEAIAARWEEFDLEAKVWTIPKDRMKAGREHRVALAPRLAKSLAAMPRHPSGFLFPGKPDRALTTAASLKVLKGLRAGLTAHGFRSTFRDWAADQTAYPRDVAEAALAHALKDKTEAAYRRTDLFEKRARLMAEWERYCFAPVRKTASVSPINGKKASAPR